MYANSQLPFATINNPASGLEMSLTLPLSVFPSRPNTVRAYALNTDTKQRMPAVDGSFLSLTLPVFAAHVRFTATAPATVPADAFVDTGAATSSETLSAGFSYGWSEDNTASSSVRLLLAYFSCIFC